MYIQIKNDYTGEWWIYKLIGEKRVEFGDWNNDGIFYGTYGQNCLFLAKSYNGNIVCEADEYLAPFIDDETISHHACNVDELSMTLDKICKKHNW